MLFSLANYYNHRVTILAIKCPDQISLVDFISGAKPYTASWSAARGTHQTLIKARSADIIKRDKVNKQFIISIIKARPVDMQFNNLMMSLL